MEGIYDHGFYRKKRDGSRNSARIVVPRVIELISPRSVVDVGCGTGSWLSVFEQSGIADILGLEFSDVDASLSDIAPSKRQNLDASQAFSLERRFDLVMNLEVAEHLPSESAPGFIRSLTRLGPVVLFSAAIPGQGGANHINEQWPSYWIPLFEANGFVPVDCLRDAIWNDHRVEWWYRQNLLLFVQKERLGCYPKLRDCLSPSGYRPALDRSMPQRYRIPLDEFPAPLPLPVLTQTPAIRTSAVILTKNGAERIGPCLESIVRSGFADEIVVCVDESTTDATAEIARRFTPKVAPLHVERAGNMEGLLREMTARCSGELVLRVDDDETLGGDWNRERILALAARNDLTHFLVPRRWIVPPGDRFISSAPWFPDLQLRLYRNDPALITWPEKLHEPMAIEGQGLTLTDRWIDHHDLVVNGRPGFLAALELTLPPPQVPSSTPARAYALGSVLSFSDQGTGSDFTRSGWSLPEPWGRWTDGPCATLRLPLESPTCGPLRLDVSAQAFITPRHPTLYITVRCEGRWMGEWPLNTGEPAPYTLTIPASVTARRGTLTLEFQIGNPASPADLGLSEDQRQLGLGLRELSLTPVEETKA